MHLDLRTRLRRLDVARPPTLPPALDAAADWWAGRGARSRRLVVGLAVLLALLGLGAVGRRPPTTETTVWVATRAASIGSSVGDVAALASRRSTDLPGDALPADTSPAGVLSIEVLPGQVLSDAHLTTDVTGLVDATTAVVAVRADQLAPVPAGATVDVLATAIDGNGQRLATRVRVLAVDDAWVWLGVPEDVAAAVAAADDGGRLSLSRRAVEASSPPPQPPPDASP